MSRALRPIASIVALLSACAAEEPSSPAATSAEPTSATWGGDAMALVPAGAFAMGCDPADDARCGPDEAPARAVTLADFFIDVTEVTRGAYAACVARGVCSAARAEFDSAWSDELPVRGVTWSDAAAFCAALGKRLPTEAEWERAARGALSSVYPWGDDPPSCALANHGACGDGPDPVGSRRDGASSDGALDLAGNVAEWTADWYAPGYDGAGPATNPAGPDAGTLRAVRGGDYARGEHALRGSARLGASPARSYAGIGFRCARSAR